MEELTMPANFDNNVAGSTILITGGASGLGEAMFLKFAQHGANVIIADTNTGKGEALVQKVRAETGSENHHFVHCDVTSYESQRQLFRKALSLSATHTLNTVIANAGVGMVDDFTELPGTVDEDPPEPNLTTLDVNLTGVVYTTRLALHHFRRNSEGEDRHLLFVGSVASFASSPGLLGLYTASKHAVLGFFRCLHMYAGPQAGDVRMNLLCPYFVATPILPRSALLLLSGLELALCEDVVEAAARLTCLKRANGRCLVVAPRSSGGIQEMDAATMHATEPFSMRLVTALRSGHRAGALVRALFAAVARTGSLFVGALVVGLVLLTLGWAGLAM